MSRLIQLCDWLPPDFGAVGQFGLRAARERCAEGCDVVLIGLTSGPARVETERFPHAVLTIVRIHRAPVERSKFGRRLLWTLATNLVLVRNLIARARRGDEILFTGSPPFLIHFLVPLRAVFGWQLVYRISDFHPECLMADFAQPPFILSLFLRLTIALRRRIDRFEVLGLDQERRLEAIGIPRARISLKRDRAPDGFAPGITPLARPSALAGKIVLLYSGNYGVAHEVDTFVTGYLLHHNQGSGRVCLWLNAIGANADRVEQRLKAQGAPVTRTNLVPLEDVPRLLTAADCHLVALKDAFWGYVLPSKVYGCLASGRPILYIGPRESDVDLLCREELGELLLYRRIAVGDARGLARALEEIADTVQSKEGRPDLPMPLAQALEA